MNIYLLHNRESESKQKGAISGMLTVVLACPCQTDFFGTSDVECL